MHGGGAKNALTIARARARQGLAPRGQPVETPSRNRARPALRAAEVEARRRQARRSTSGAIKWDAAADDARATWDAPRAERDELARRAEADVAPLRERSAASATKTTPRRRQTACAKRREPNGRFEDARRRHLVAIEQSKTNFRRRWID